MLAQFSIWPLDRPHMSVDVAIVTKVFDLLGIRSEVGPMGTTVEDQWHEVLEAVHACHQTLRAAHQRVLTTMTIDDDAPRVLHMNDATAKVAQRREEERT